MKHSFIVLDYPSIAAVAAVIHEGTFERAAAALGITSSAVSQRVRGLEERLGAILVVRGQPCQPTDLGRALAAHLDRVRLLEHDLAPVLGDVSAQAAAPLKVGIAVNADSFATWLPTALAAFVKDTGASLDLVLEDEAHTGDRLRSGQVLAAVTADAQSVQGCKTVALGSLSYAACASPDFTARHFAKGFTPSALAKAPYMRFDRRDFLQHRWAREVHDVELAGPPHWVPSTQGFLDLTLQGAAWSLHPLTLAEPHLVSGKLIELPPKQRIEVPLYWTVARLHAAPLRQLTEAIRDAAGSLLVQ